MKATKSILVMMAGAVFWPAVLLADSGQTTPDRITEPTHHVAAVSPMPLQLALVPDVQLVPQYQSVQGFRLNIYGANQNVTGVDIGLVHETKGHFRGAEFGVVNIVRGDCTGMQLAGIYSETHGRMTGWQVGMANHAGHMKGVQLGFVNMADDMTGIQIGIVNIINAKESYKVLPLINAKF